MKKRYEIGDKVKLVPESRYYGKIDQGGGTIGEVVEYDYDLPENDDDISEDEYCYTVEWGNGDRNYYCYTDLMPAEEIIKPGDWVIGWHNGKCELYHTPWKVEKFDKSGSYAIPEGHPGWNCNISHLIKVPAPQQLSMEKEWKPKFKIGDRVQAIDESNGWGKVEYGDIGVVVHVPKNKHGVYRVNFDKHSGWDGTEECFILEESAPKDESVEGEFVYSPPMVKIITSNGISSEFKNEQSINLLIHKPKKVKLLKIN